MFFADRVLETTAVTGTGDITPTGAVAGFRTFAAGVTAEAVIDYALYAVDDRGNPSGDWETGTGKYTATGYVERTAVTASSSAGAAVSFTAGTKYIMLTTSAATQNKALVYGVGGGFEAAPAVSEHLFYHTFTDNVVFPDDWAGSRGNVRVNPTASFTLSVNKNGAEIGTIVISTGGAATFATTGTGVETFAPGDVLRVTAPATVDATIAGCSWTLRGVRT